MIETLKTLSEAQRTLNEKFKSQGENLVRLAFTEFFKKNPEIVAVKWVQYTPYFNDGYPCTFHLGEFEVMMADDEEWSDTFALAEPLNTNVGELEDQIQSIDAHLEAIFGEHAEITITATDIDITEYEHD